MLIDVMNSLSYVKTQNLKHQSTKYKMSLQKQILTQSLYEPQVFVYHNCV